VRGPPDVQVMFKSSEGGERSRRRNGIARNMLRAERCCRCGGWDDCCCCCDDSDRAEPVLGFAVAGIMFDAGGASRVVTLCRRRTTTGGGVGEDAGDDDDDEDVVTVVLVWALVEEVLLLLVLGGGAGGEFEGETAMPKGVSSSFTLDEDATFLVAGRTRG
jgi:hypothetical protein